MLDSNFLRVLSATVFRCRLGGRTDRVVLETAPPSKLEKEVCHGATKEAPFFLYLILSISIVALAAGTDEKESKPEQKRKPIIEEVVVTGKAPAQQPISRVSRIPRATIDALIPAHMDDVVNYTTGVYATDGNKNESRLMIRGLGSSRITLMLDGIPVYDPYFNSFDLKSISATNVDSVKVIKGRVRYCMAQTPWVVC